MLKNLLLIRLSEICKEQKSNEKLVFVNGWLTVAQWLLAVGLPVLLVWIGKRAMQAIFPFLRAGGAASTLGPGRCGQTLQVTAKSQLHNTAKRATKLKLIYAMAKYPCTTGRHSHRVRKCRQSVHVRHADTPQKETDPLKLGTDIRFKSA